VTTFPALARALQFNQPGRLKTREWKNGKSGMIKNAGVENAEVKTWLVPPFPSRVFHSRVFSTPSAPIMNVLSFTTYLSNAHL